MGEAGTKVQLSLTAMPNWFGKALFILILIVQVGWLLSPRLSKLSHPYRLAERRNALLEWGRTKTPESKAIWDKERMLLDSHLGIQAVLVLAAFVVVDGVGIYLLLNPRRGKQKA